MWNLKCERCAFASQNLVEMQEHVMGEHKIPLSDIQTARKFVVEGPVEAYGWTQPNSKALYTAKRAEAL